jgi:hypothetical protein
VRARWGHTHAGQTGSGSGSAPQSASDPRSGMTGGARPSARAAGRPRVGLVWAKQRLGCWAAERSGPRWFVFLSFFSISDFYSQTNLNSKRIRIQTKI